MTAPFFSILLPAKGRPQLVRDALTSVLRQEFSDFEIVVSNNGADSEVRSAIADLVRDNRVRYCEQSTVINMPDHWEKISLLTSGKFIMVLPDRSVLTQGALRSIKNIHDAFGSSADIVSWPWHVYYEGAGLLMRTESSPNSRLIESDDILTESSIMRVRYPYAMPRGLNSSVARELLLEMRQKTGAAFAPLSPDFSFGYQALLLRRQFVYHEDALMISQGLGLSNGGNALSGDARPYYASLGLAQPFEYAPAKSLIAESGLAEDYLRLAHKYDRQDLVRDWDRVGYYIRCLAELDEKRRSRVVPGSYIDELEIEVSSALRAESVRVQTVVDEARRGRGSLAAAFRFAMRRILGPAVVNALRPYLLRARGARKYKSVLAAAGFVGGR